MFSARDPFPMGTVARPDPRTSVVVVGLHKKYRLIRTLGQGSFGKVYLCTSAEDGKRYAVKVISTLRQMRSGKAVPSDRRRFQAEIQAMTLKHENVVRFEGLDTKEDSESSYTNIRMEYCAKGSLDEVIAKSTLRFNESIIWRIVQGCLAGLNEIHNKNLIHRDIKPGNILLATGWRPKIGDFGLSKDGNLNKFTTNVGTALYIAPEVLIANQAYGSMADIYRLASSLKICFSLGLVFFELINSLIIPDPKDQLAALQKFRLCVNRRLQDSQETTAPSPSLQSLTSFDSLDSSADSCSYQLYPPTFGVALKEENRIYAQELVHSMTRSNPNNRSSAQELLSLDRWDELLGLSAMLQTFYVADPPEDLEDIIQKARDAAARENVTERLRIWREIVVSQENLRPEERQEAVKACEPLHRLLPEDSEIDPTTAVEHSKLAIETLDILLDDVDLDDIWVLLLSRWNNDNVLRSHGVGFQDSDSQAEAYIGKTREAYSRFSAVHHQRTWLMTHFIARLKDAKNQTEILKELYQDVFDAQAGFAMTLKSGNALSQDDRKLSLNKLDKVLAFIEKCQEKADLMAKAQTAGLQGEFPKRLNFWMEIVKMKVELSSEEIEEFLQAVKPLRTQVSDENYSNLQPNDFVDFSKLAISLLDCLLIRTTIAFEGLLPALLQARWENDSELREYEQHYESEDEQAKFYLKKAHTVFERYSKADAERIRVILELLDLVADPLFKHEQLTTLKTEVEADIPSLTSEGSILRSREGLAKIVKELESF